MKRSTLKCFITALIVLFGALTAVASPQRIYRDAAHGEPQATPAPLVAIAEKLNVEIHVGTSPIDAVALHGCKLLYLRAPTKPFSASEKSAILGYINAGGSLLLVFDEERRMPLAEIGVNDLIAPFGLMLTADAPYLHNCGAIAKAGPINRADRELPYSGGRAVEGGTAFAWQLDREGRPAQAFAAFHQLENGARIVVMAEGMAAAFLGKPEGVRLSGENRNAANTIYWGKDSALFMEEVLGWLMK